MVLDPNADRPPRRRRGAPIWLIGSILLIVLALLLLRSCGDDDADSGPVGGGSGTEQTTSTSEADAGDGSGSITAGGDDVLEAARGGALGGLEGEDVDATGVTVQSVVDETGFWIGSGESDRVFVEVEQESEAAIEVEQGDAVSFTGVIEKNLESETYGLRASSGAAQFREQGFHIQVQEADLKTG